IPNASVLYRARLTPDDTAAIGASRTARKARPSEPRKRNHARPNISPAIAQLRYESHSLVERPPIGEEGSAIVLPWPPPVKPSNRLATSGIDVARLKV